MPPRAVLASERPHTRAWTKAQAQAQLAPAHNTRSRAKERSAKSGRARPVTVNNAVKPQRRGRSQATKAIRQTAAGRTRSEKVVPQTHQVISKHAIESRSAQNPDHIKRTQRRLRRSALRDIDNQKPPVIQTSKDTGAPSASQLSVVDNSFLVSTWLRQVRSVSRERLLEEKTYFVASETGFPADQDDTMDSSSTSHDQTGGASTAKATTGRSNKLTESKLRLRRVQREKSDDARMGHLRSIMGKEPKVPCAAGTHRLAAEAQNFIDRVNEGVLNSGMMIDRFSLKFDEEKARMRYPIINDAYFDAQLRKCRSKNEAVLQRTIMMSVFHYYWLGDTFDWNAEAQWSQPRDARLPSRQDDDIVLPKPDLAISFTLRSFTGDEDDSDPIPPDLERCISPDGGTRCFPFVFMEVKKAAADLQEAYLANLHSASQALYNIYQWMARAGEQKAFFETVRVFSFVFNAQDLGVRVHRASQLADGNISFCFDEFYPLERFSRDQVCHLVNTIIYDYGKNELHKTLLSAYRDVVRQEDERVRSKQRASAARAPKRQRRSDDVSQHTGQSFGMAQLHA